MFGGVAFMVARRMCCGVHKDRMILRLPVDEADALLRRGEVGDFDIQSRPLRGFVTVAPNGCSTAKQVKGWLQRATPHALATAPSAAPYTSPRLQPRAAVVYRAKPRAR